jgi:hypothetical protein
VPDDKEADGAHALLQRVARIEERSEAFAWTVLRTDPADIAAMRAVYAKLGVVIEEEFQRYERRRNFRRRLKETLWHAILPILAAVIPWLFPPVGQFLLQVLRHLIAEKGS